MNKSGSTYELEWTITADSGGDFSYESSPSNISKSSTSGPSATSSWFGRIDRVVIRPVSDVSIVETSRVKVVACDDATQNFLHDVGVSSDLSATDTFTDGVLTAKNGYAQKLHGYCVVPLVTDIGDGAVIELKLLLVND